MEACQAKYSQCGHVLNTDIRN